MAMELSLDLRLAYVPNTISHFLTEISVVRDASQKMAKLEAYVSRLEDEIRKIDAFKRELPLCMFLLTDAVVRLKKETMQCLGSRNGASKEEFLPLKGNSGLCSVLELNLKSETENRSPTEKPPCNYGNRGGGAYVPFKTTVSEVSEVPALCLAVPLPEPGCSDEKPRIGGGDCGGGAGSGCPVSAERVKLQSKTLQQQAASRKQRRCWSPELHRRFVDSLQRLGGWKVATPKQIREIMQVDGLTNDEVKSHLQKYRIHIRKLPRSVSKVSEAEEENERSECHSWKIEVNV